jgi:hypothetical protein
MKDPLKYAERIAYSSKEVLKFTYDKAKEYANTPDVCYIECGVAAGAQVIAMRAGSPNTTIYAIDSYKGLPMPSNKDDQFPGIRMISKEEQSKLPNPGEQVLESTGAVSVSLGDFEQHLINVFGNTNNVIPISGWFEETLPTLECPPIAILRLDGDLYNSTYVCLKYLYPKVIEGGLIIIDDWALEGCRKAVYDYFDVIGNGSFFCSPWGDRIKHIRDENSTVVYWTK